MKKILIGIGALLLIGGISIALSATPTNTPIATPTNTPTATPVPATVAPSPTIPTVTPVPVEKITTMPATATKTPTATPDLTDFQVQVQSFTSPDKKWIAQVIIGIPVTSDTTMSSNYYTQLKLSETDGPTEWVIVDEWSEWGLGYTVPQPLHWSHNGQYLYITNKPVPDGCAVFVNGSDLRRVDLRSGDVKEILPSVGLWLSLSPDETKIAYIGYGKRGLVIRDLVTGTEQEVQLDPGKDYQAGHIIWSPDSNTIVLALAIQPCSTGWADSTSIIRVDAATLESATVLREDKRLFIPVEWTAADQVLLKDKEGNSWLMNATTGQITRK